jgi:hypothetical protein
MAGKENFYPARNVVRDAGVCVTDSKVILSAGLLRFAAPKL